jgi:putative transposase
MVLPLFLDPQTPVRETESRLPHWQQDQRTFFVTFRMADALPAFLLRDFENERLKWLRVHPKPWTIEVEREYHERFTVLVDRWLDDGQGECLLRDPGAAKIVADILQRYEGEKSEQIAWVVMPNHVHAVFSLLPGSSLESLLKQWKGASARLLNVYFGREGSFWQKDYFDRMIRDAKHLENVIGYIRRNPVKAKLRVGEYLYWERPNFDLNG